MEEHVRVHAMHRFLKESQKAQTLQKVVTKLSKRKIVLEADIFHQINNYFFLVIIIRFCCIHLAALQTKQDRIVGTKKILLVLVLKADLFL